MANRNALGRGLKALLPDEPVGDVEGTSTQLIALDKISPNPFQPRETFNPETLTELKQSIAEKGVVQPVTVRRSGDGYQLIAGERRLRAAREAGLVEIPAYILAIESDEEMLELSIIENIHREDLNPIDVARGYKTLIEECHLNQEDIARKIGKDRTTITNFLRLLKLPRPIQDSVRKNEISMGHARALLSLPSEELQKKLWKKIIRNGLSVRQVEASVRSLPAAPTPQKAARPFYLEDFENRLRSRLTTKVIIRSRRRGGAIEIDYYSDDELERLISLICGE